MTSREFRSIFWDDLAADLDDPAFRDSYIESSAVIAKADWASTMSEVKEQDDEKRPR